MTLRGKRIPIAIILLCLLLFYLHKMADRSPSMSLYLRKRLFDDNVNDKSNSINSQSVVENDKLTISNQDTSEMFKLASKCLEKAKKEVAGYLRENQGPIDSDAQYSSNLVPECNREYLLIVLVTTRPGNFANRVAIRMSWGRMDSVINSYIEKTNGNFTWKTIFSVGLAMSPNIGSLVALENEKYKDILRLPYKDEYKNLPNKTMNSLEWIGNNCKSKFVLKTDDDCFINIFQMLPWLQGLPSNYDYIGRVNTQMPVIRDPKHRNFVPKADHKDNYYKPYCAGGGYILRGSLLKNITKVGKQIKQIINEDAYMGMLTSRLGIVPRNEERFLPYIFFGPPVKKLHMCDWKDQFLIHNVFGKRQLIMHYNSIAMKYFNSLCEKFR